MIREIMAKRVIVVRMIVVVETRKISTQVQTVSCPDERCKGLIDVIGDRDGAH